MTTSAGAFLQQTARRWPSRPGWRRRRSESGCPARATAALIDCSLISPGAPRRRPPRAAYRLCSRKARARQRPRLRAASSRSLAARTSLTACSVALAWSLRAALPMAAASPSMSSRSSAIWKARPRRLAVGRQGTAIGVAGPPQDGAGLAGEAQQGPRLHGLQPLHVSGRRLARHSRASRLRDRGTGHRPCPRHRRHAPAPPPAPPAPQGRHAPPAKPGSRTPGSTGRRPPGWPSIRRRPCAPSAARAAARRCPSPAGRRAPANSSARIRPQPLFRPTQPSRRRTSRHIRCTRKGRSRLPPPSAPCRMAATSRPGAPAAAALSRSSASRASTSCADCGSRWLKTMRFPYLAGSPGARRAAAFI